MKTLLIVLGVLFFINILPIGARIQMEEEAFILKLVFGLIQIKILPKNQLPKEKTPEAKQAAAEKKRAGKEKKQIQKIQKKEKPKEKKPIGTLIDEFLPLVQLGLNAIGNLRWLFTIRKLNLHFCYGGSDAGACALNYGKACAVVSAGMAVLTRNLHIRDYDIVPELDYSCDKMRIHLDAVVTLTLGVLFGFLFKYGFSALRILLKNNKKRRLMKHESSTT